MTHYPRLADLKDEFPGKVGPYFVSYLAEGQVNKQSEGPISQYEEEATQRITFLYKLVPGIASRSFGLHVARLAQVCTLYFSNYGEGQKFIRTRSRDLAGKSFRFDKFMLNR